MYKEHPSFKPINDDDKIWRFIELAKFCDLLNKGSLFFSVPENFIDPWEGFLPKRHFDENSYIGVPQDVARLHVELAKERLPKAVRNNFAVSCWHINQYESEALWKNYSNRGIAIQTTFGKLKKSLNVKSDYDVFIGKVDYKDQDTDFVDMSNMFNQLLWKRKSFEYENELRAVIWQLADTNGKGARNFDSSKGQEIKIDLDLLVENIYTTPFEKDEWFKETVSNLIKRYGYKFNCEKSKLMDKPF